MDERAVKSEFGQIIVNSFPLNEIIAIGRLTDALSELYEKHWIEIDDE